MPINMSFSSIKNCFSFHRDHIIHEMRDRLQKMPWSPYQDFLFRTKEGQRRLKIWVDMVIESLDGEQELFFMDQERLGYSRAIQGFEFENVGQIYHTLHQVFWEILQKETTKEKLRSSNLIGEVYGINDLLFRGYRIVANSFLKTREGQIDEKMKYLQALYSFTQKIITAFELEKIVEITLSQIKTLFTTENCYLALYRDRHSQLPYCNFKKPETHEISQLIEKALNEETTLFMDEEMNIYKDIELSRTIRVVSIAITAHDHCFGVLALYSETKGFKFTNKELNLLHQFLHILAVAIENAFMLDEIELQRKDLQRTTSKMITIQEEERKRLAEDIHDTIAQSLTGISYKMQFCKEVLHKKSELLADQFDNLLEAINRTIDQSRQLIKNLRPDLIDTIGLVAALEKYIESFQQETGIRVDVQLPTKVDISSIYSICLFRVAQEALMNVYKHAQTKTAKVILKREPQTATLVIADDGKGFDVSMGAIWAKNPDKLGLLSIKERIAAVGGDYSLHTGIGQGCRIEAKIFLNQEADNNAED